MVGIRIWSKRAGWLLLLSWLLTAPASAQEGKKRRSTRASRPKTTRPKSAARPKTARANAAPAKSKTQLERERRRNLRQIQETSRVLTQTTQKKQVSLGQLNVLKEKLTVKKTVIKGISTQLQGLETGVRQTVQQVQQTQQTLAELRVEYARLLYGAAKTANGFNRLMFLFAADSFNEFARRLRYVRQYTEERQTQAQRIVRAQQQLNQQLTGLTEQQRRKQRLLGSQLAENQNLLSLKTQQDEMVEQLSQREQDLRRELEERQQAGRRLDNLIAERVREEIARAARAARLAARRELATAARRAARPSRSARPAADSESRANPAADAPETAAEAAADRRASRVVLTPENSLLSSSFAGNRGRLPWPVGRGFISQRFGRHPHPVLRHVVVENRGVDIQTGDGEPVRACFDGTVLTVASIAGMNNIVMIQHGDYFTVYAKLRAVSVREGQRVRARDAIGTVATNTDGAAEVQFQVWHNSSNLNPENWLGGR